MKLNKIVIKKEILSIPREKHVTGVEEQRDLLPA